MALNIALAIRFTPYYARSVGWKIELAKICSFLGFYNSYPDPKGFVTAVAKWQAKNHLDPDGMIGPDTWRKMKPALDYYFFPIHMVGPHPDWVYQIDASADINPLPPPPRMPNPSQASSEDRVIKEMIKLIDEQKHSNGVAIAVSPQYIARQGYPLGSRFLDTSGIVSGRLEIGQEWKGIEGNRLIVGLSGGLLVRNGDGTYTLSGMVLFVTESGQAYEQTLTGWESDLWSKIYADVYEALAPIRRMLEVEIAFLNAAQAAYNFPLYLAVHGGAFYLEHKDKIPIYIAIVYALYEMSKKLKEVAPTLYDKVFWTILKRIGDNMWDFLLRDNLTPEGIAKFLGALIVSRGKAFFAEAATGFKKALQICLKTLSTLANLLISSVKATGKNEIATIEDSINVLRKMGVVLSEIELKNVTKEFQDNEQVIMELFRELEKNVEKL